MSQPPRYIYLVIHPVAMEATSFNQLQDNLRAFKVREVATDICLVFANEDHASLSKRLFKGVAPGSEAVLALISQTVSVPE